MIKSGLIKLGAGPIRDKKKCDKEFLSLDSN